MSESGFERELTSVELGLWADALGKLAEAEFRIADAELRKTIVLCEKAAAITPLERIRVSEQLIKAEASAGIAIIERMAARDELRLLASLS